MREAYPKKILADIGLEAGMKVGDFGCGQRGTFTFAAAEIVGESGRVYAVDILKIVIKSIEDQSKLEGIDQIIKTVWSNLEKYQATKIDEELDIGLLINVLFQTDKPLDIIKESVRMIKKDGLLFVSDWLPDSQVAKTELKNIRTTEEIKKLAGKADLELIDEFNPWQSHFGLVFRK